MHDRRLLVLLGLLALVLAAALASIAVGTRSLAPGEVWRGLFSSDPTSEAAVIVRQLRLPPTVLGLMAGAALGMAGALTQGPHPQPARRPGAARSWSTRSARPPGAGRPR